MEKEETVKIVRSVAAAQDLSRLIENNYELEGPVRCQLRSIGCNDTYVVAAGLERYILRVYFPRYWIADPSHYQFEMDWLISLHRRGLPISHPIQRRDGEWLGSIPTPEGTRYWTLMSWAPGEYLYPMNDEQAYAFGRGIAEIQQASDQFKTEHSRFHYDLDFLFVDPLEHIAELMVTQCAEDVAYITTVAQKAKAQIEALALPEDSYGIVGGDYHGGNNYFADNAPTFFDFDIGGYGYKVYDLAVFYHNNLLNGTMGNQWAPILTGYESVRTLSKAEKAAIVPFAVGRRIWRVGTRAYESAFMGDQVYHDYGDYWRFTMEAMRRWDEELSR
jgi:Ser/Thr protein kinase RdoA (MazF antagonist)